MTETSKTVEAGMSAGESSQRSILELARSIFLSWEKLRLIYLGVCAAWCVLLTVALALPHNPHEAIATIPVCVVGGIFANCCYFAGPVVETYAAWLGMRNHYGLRVLLFILGTLFTLAMAFFVIGGALMTGFE